MTAQPLVDVCVAQRPSDYLISTNQPLCLRLWIAWIIPFACNQCLKPDGRGVAVASLWLHLLEFRKPNLAPASVGAFIMRINRVGIMSRVGAALAQSRTGTQRLRSAAP